jgi:SIR2-like domain
MPETLVLLGAGASHDAGIPMAVPMVGEMLTGAHVLSEDRPHFCHLLKSVHQRLTDHVVELGGDPSTIDIEQLANAVQALDSRESSDLAPFVERWRADLTSTVDEERDFGWLYEQMLWSVQKICTIDRSEGSRVDYLAPLLEVLDYQRPLVIATLNYDNTIELMCRRYGVEVIAPGPREVVGVTQWVHLLHLHGSVSWNRVRISGAHTGGETHWYSNNPDPPSLHESNYQSHLPALLFAGHNKLRADGPWLELLTTFERELATAARLVIVGYGFRDEHINALLHKRDRAGARLDIVICDPTPPEQAFAWRILSDGSQVRYVLQGAGDGLFDALFKDHLLLSDNTRGWPNGWSPPYDDPSAPPPPIEPDAWYMPHKRFAGRPAPLPGLPPRPTGTSTPRRASR